MKLSNLLKGTVVAFVVLLLTDYLYYSVIGDENTSGSVWGPKIIYTVLYSLAFAYLYIKSAGIKAPVPMGGIMVGLFIGFLVIAGGLLMARLAVITPGADGIFILLQNIVTGAVLSYTVPTDPCADGIGGQGGDDEPRKPTI